MRHGGRLPGAPGSRSPGRGYPLGLLALTLHLHRRTAPRRRAGNQDQTAQARERIDILVYAAVFLHEAY
ncbi:hypothetical protein AB0C89_38980, partial [Streptomyces sp. NPDC048491]